MGRDNKAQGKAPAPPWVCITLLIYPKRGRGMSFEVSAAEPARAETPLQPGSRIRFQTKNLALLKVTSIQIGISHDTISRKPLIYVSKGIGNLVLHAAVVPSKFNMGFSSSIRLVCIARRSSGRVLAGFCSSHNPLACLFSIQLESPSLENCLHRRLSRCRAPPT